MRVSLVPELSTIEKPEVWIGRMAAKCYDGKVDEVSCQKRTLACLKNQHLTTLRFGYATMQIGDISRVCSHQLVRLAHAGMLQESQRYVELSGIEFVDPPELEGCPVDFKYQWATVQDMAEALYQEAVQKKYLVKGDARYILPQGCTTAINMTGNFQMWLHFIGLRADKAAQWEIRWLAEACLEILNGIAPNVFPLDGTYSNTMPEGWWEDDVA